MAKIPKEVLDSWTQLTGKELDDFKKAGFKAAQQMGRTPADRLKEIENQWQIRQVGEAADDVKWLIARVKELTEALGQAIEGCPSNVSPSDFRDTLRKVLTGSKPE